MLCLSEWLRPTLEQPVMGTVDVDQKVPWDLENVIVNIVNLTKLKIICEGFLDRSPEERRPFSMWAVPLHGPGSWTNCKGASELSISFQLFLDYRHKVVSHLGLRLP